MSTLVETETVTPRKPEQEATTIPSHSPTPPSRICPECLNTSEQKGFFTDTEGLFCKQCGIQLRGPALPRRSHDESTDHAATNALHYRNRALGGDMSFNQVRDLLNRNGGDYRDARVISGLANEKDVEAPALAHASKILEENGLKYTAVSPNQESRLSHIIGEDVGTIIRKYYRWMQVCDGFGRIHKRYAHTTIAEASIALQITQEFKHLPITSLPPCFSQFKNGVCEECVLYVPPMFQGVVKQSSCDKECEKCKICSFAVDCRKNQILSFLGNCGKRDIEVIGEVVYS